LSCLFLYFCLMFANYHLLDSLTASNRSFAVYRIPKQPLVMHLQTEGDPCTMDHFTDLNGCSGFVMAPFQISEHHPVVLIPSNLVIKGEQTIFDYLEELGLDYPGTVLSSETKVSVPETDEGFLPYKNAFELFQRALHAGSCDKIVLSRTLEKALPKNFSSGELFKVACITYPDAFVYLCHTPVTGTWIGSTPEVLLSGESGKWQTVALAGTKKMSGQTTSTDWDLKNIREQKVVTAYLEKQLRIKNLIGSISEPYTVQAGAMLHLKTDFTFERVDPEKVGDLLDFLHPTPAVCGYPKTEAYRLILAHEGYDRAYYGGFIGPLGVDGKTDLYVNLRCAKVGKEGLTLYAGGGLMPDSEFKTEWEETEMKMQTLLTLL
jgi:isochorismate synthase